MSGKRYFSSSCPCTPSASDDGSEWCRCISYTIHEICQGGPGTALIAFAQARTAGKLEALEVVTREVAGVFPLVADAGLRELLAASAARDELGCAWAIGRLHGILAGPEAASILEEFADLFDAGRPELARRASRVVRDGGGVGPEDVAQHLAVKIVSGVRRQTIKQLSPHWRGRGLRSAAIDIVRTEERHRHCDRLDADTPVACEQQRDDEWHAVRRALLTFLREADEDDRKIVLAQVAAARRSQKLSQSVLGEHVGRGREWTNRRLKMIRERLIDLLWAELADM